MQTVHVNFVMHRVITELIRLTIGKPTFGAITSQPHGETLGIVNTTVDTLHNWSPTKFSAPYHQSVLQQSALF